jgi:hypothetical protein
MEALAVGLEFGHAGMLERVGGSCDADEGKGKGVDVMWASVRYIAARRHGECAPAPSRQACSLLLG